MDDERYLVEGDEEEDMDPIVKYPMRNRMTGTTKDIIRREK